MKIKEGEKWIVDTRGANNMQVRLLKTIETKKDDFFDAIIIAGERHYISFGREPDRPGDITTMRTTLTNFKERVRA